MTENRQAFLVLVMNTLAFTICFMCWMMNGVLITYLVDNGVFRWTPAEMGWLIGIPVLTGSVTRLPVGILTDKYGGRIVYGMVMLLSAVFMYMVSFANSYEQFLMLGLGFGLSGASFAVGIAYTSVWFPAHKQGTALGIFGAGNAGAAVTSLGAPHLLNWFTNNGQDLEGWRMLPKVYAGSLVVMAVIFFLFTHTKLAVGGQQKTFSERLAPLRALRVWRFGLYYFLVFGGFVALAQWLIPYYVNVYAMSVAMAGFMAAIFSLPSGVIRAAGGWMSDKFGPRPVMQWVLGACVLCCGLLIVPQMDISSPGSGVMARRAGVVKSVSEREIVVESLQGEVRYAFMERIEEAVPETVRASGMLVLPKAASWQEPVVKPGESVSRKQLLARGVTHIFFQANVWIFTGLVFIVGIAMGIGKAAVYRHIPDYFPGDVGVVGGMVGVLGGLGGFFCPIVFGYLLQETGLWTTCWMFFFLLSLACLVWMMVVIRRLTKKEAPNLVRQIETEEFSALGEA
jgi:NNP family nitrate/nitrite transporter-like MFS transporter